MPSFCKGLSCFSKMSFWYFEVGRKDPRHLLGSLHGSENILLANVCELSLPLGISWMICWKLLSEIV